MLGGLLHETESGPQVTAAYTATGAPSGGNSQAAPAATASANAETSASVTETGAPSTADAIDSHLDSFFQSHALTREDVLVLAAVVQLLAWSALLYLEVSDS